MYLNYYIIDTIQNSLASSLLTLQETKGSLQGRPEIVGLMVIYHARWAPTNYKWSYNPYKWPYKWLTGVITLLIGVITPLITSRGPTLQNWWIVDLFPFPRGLFQGSMLVFWGVFSNFGHCLRKSQCSSVQNCQTRNVRWMDAWENFPSSPASSWWLNQPVWKICSSNWIISPNYFGWK